MLKVQVLPKDVLLVPNDKYFFNSSKIYLKEINKSNTTLLINDKMNLLRYILLQKKREVI